MVMACGKEGAGGIYDFGLGNLKEIDNVEKCDVNIKTDIKEIV
jgi:hypothetical protein